MVYNSGVEIPKIDFSLVNFNKIAPGSYFLGFNLGDSGKLTKMDNLGNCTVVEGMGTITGVSGEVITSDGSNGGLGQSNLTFNGSTLRVNTIEIGLGGASHPSNLAIGNKSLTYNSAGYNNLSIGLESLLNNSTGGCNIAIGNRALRENNGSYNLAIGYQSLRCNTTGDYNAALGQKTLY
jgi:hypothetical protein